MVIFITLVAAVIASLSQILFKKALGKASVKGIMDIFRALKTKLIIIGGAGYILSLMVYLSALANAPLSVIYPIFASSFIFTVLFSAKFLGERVSSTRIIGLALVFAGVVIIAVYTL